MDQQVGLNGYMFRLRITTALSWILCYAGDHKVGRYGNECLAIRVMGVSTLLLKHVNC